MKRLMQKIMINTSSKSILLLGILSASLLFALTSSTQADEAVDIKQCAQQKVAFDGIKPLKYADITGEPNSHIPLLYDHPALCSSANEATCKGKAYLIPGNTVAVANTCGDYVHVQFIGGRRVTTGWINTSQLEDRPNTDSTKDVSKGFGIFGQERKRYRFKLTVGSGTPVCEAYLQRLNRTLYDGPPFCGRPEDTSVPGFEFLKREALSSQEILRLIAHVTGFMEGPSQKAAELTFGYFDEKGQRVMTPPWRLEDIESSQNIHVWRYSPEVDIDNDGQPDNLIIWHGDGADTSLNRCGVTFGNDPTPAHIEQRAFIVKPDNIWVDEDRTKAIFEIPSHGYLGLINGKKAYKDGFAPIGASISIFRFRNTYYFDAFFDPDFGDFKGNRRDNKVLYNTLGVFKHEAGSTRQICELRDDE